MDPLSALIGGGMSIIGGLMNTSSQQAINSANLQQQMYLANNAVSMRVADANRAGINPLAALGVSSPGFSGATPTDPGAGVMAAGREIMRVDPYIAEKRDLDLERSRVEIANARLAGNNTALDMAQKAALMEYLRMHPDMIPAGADQPTATTMIGGMGAGWLNSLNRSIQGLGSSVGDFVGRGIGAIPSPMR